MMIEPYTKATIDAKDRPHIFDTSIETTYKRGKEIRSNGRLWTIAMKDRATADRAIGG